MVSLHHGWFLFRPVAAGPRFIIASSSSHRLRHQPVLRPEAEELRKKNKKEYSIPRGGLFELISSPNYFGEIIEWTGWAVLTWSLPGLAFAVFTFANLFRGRLTITAGIKRIQELSERKKAIIRSFCKTVTSILTPVIECRRRRRIEMPAFTR